MSETRMQMPPVCGNHRWEPFPGPEFDYRTNRQMWFGERAAVICHTCHARTWLSREEIASAPRAATTEGGRER